jgi:hypothetical protein
MIDDPCKAGDHNNCTNPDTCPCQHRTTIKQADGTVSPTSERNALRMVEQPGKILEAK